MAGATIDHLISVTVFIAALVLFISLFNQTIQTAILYQRHRYLATKCSDLLDNMLLNPAGWNGSTPTTFGLQDPEFQQYKMSPFSLMRLLSSSGSKVYYNRTGNWYSNVSWGVNGGYFLLRESECISYSTASRLLGVNGSYGFQLRIAPTLMVNVTETAHDPLGLTIRVTGSGFPLSNATIEYFLFWTSSSKQGEFQFGNTTTDSLGKASVGFPSINIGNNATAYTFVAKAHTSGLYGMGYSSHEITTKAGNIMPFVESYVNGTVLLAHKWGKNDPGGSLAALHFNATFYLLSDNFSPVKVDITNTTGVVNYGKGKPFFAIRIPTSNTGFLCVTYWTGNEYGMIVMPWGIGMMGTSILFGGNPHGQEWVATDMRQVLVIDNAYQTKLALWSLTGNTVVS